MNVPQPVIRVLVRAGKELLRIAALAAAKKAAEAVKRRVRP